MKYVLSALAYIGFSFCLYELSHFFGHSTDNIEDRIKEIPGPIPLRLILLFRFCSVVTTILVILNFCFIIPLVIGVILQMHGQRVWKSQEKAHESEFRDYHIQQAEKCALCKEERQTLTREIILEYCAECKKLNNVGGDFVPPLER